MADVPNTPNDEQDSNLPDSLRRDLAWLYESPVKVPSRVDDAVLNRARAALAGKRYWTGRPALRWAGAAVAAACAVVVMRVALRAPLSPDDIDGNHRVDIVDALKLAHQVQSGTGRDITGDGIVDQRDVDSIAMNVVTLHLPGGVQ